MLLARWGEFCSVGAVPRVMQTADVHSFLHIYFCLYLGFDFLVLPLISELLLTNKHVLRVSRSVIFIYIMFLNPIKFLK